MNYKKAFRILSLTLAILLAFCACSPSPAAPSGQDSSVSDASSGSEAEQSRDAGELITAAAVIIDNVSVYTQQLEAYRNQYGDPSDPGSLGLMKYGIRFDVPVPYGSGASVSEAVLCYPNEGTDRSLKDPGYVILYTDGGYPWWGWNEQYHNVPLTVTGYLRPSENGDKEIMEYNDDEHPPYLYFPNGPYEFEIVSIET